jgi:uncharacterized protein
VKLLVVEPESDRLWEVVKGRRLLCSALAEVEVPRALARRGIDPHAPAVTYLLDGLLLLEVDSRTLHRAAALRPPGLLSSEAIHIASALGVVERLSGFVAYDDRLLTAARACGLPILSPGAR